MEKACPACKQIDHFFVQAQCIYRVNDMGAEQDGDLDWDERSYTRCPCGWFGTWGDLVDPVQSSHEKVYTITIKVLRGERDEHPNKWDWSELLDAEAELVSIEEDSPTNQGTS